MDEKGLRRLEHVDGPDTPHQLRPRVVPRAWRVADSGSGCGLSLRQRGLPPRTGRMPRDRLGRIPSLRNDPRPQTSRGGEHAVIAHGVESRRGGSGRRAWPGSPAARTPRGSCRLATADAVRRLPGRREAATGARWPRAAAPRISRAAPIAHGPARRSRLRRSAGRGRRRSPRGRSDRRAVRPAGRCQDRWRSDLGPRRSRARRATDRRGRAGLPRRDPRAGQAATLEQPRDPMGDSHRHLGHLGVFQRRQREKAGLSLFKRES
jgi:hypothetical protein